MSLPRREGTSAETIGLSTLTAASETLLAGVGYDRRTKCSPKNPTTIANRATRTMSAGLFICSLPFDWDELYHSFVEGGTSQVLTNGLSGMWELAGQFPRDRLFQEL